MSGNGQVIAAVICACCCLGLWFGLFFGLNYSEVRVNTVYKLASCTVLDSAVVDRYCCNKACSCSECGAQQSCSSYIGTSQSVRPHTCQGTNRTAACPADNPVACCDGYYCCRRCCSTCRSCHRCGKSGTCCSSYECNCFCCSSVSNQYCTVTCPTCWSTDYHVSYVDVNGGEHGPLFFSSDHRYNLAEAQLQKDNYFPGSKLNCWYDPDDFNSVVFTRGYTWWKWFLTAWPTAFLLCIFAACTAPLMDSFMEGYLGSGSEAAKVVTLWLGFVIPIVIFLPIATAGAIPDAAKVALKITLCELIWLGWLPVAVLWQDHKNLNGNWIAFFYALLVVLPLGILIPIGVGVGGSLTTPLVAIGIVLPVTAFVVFLLYDRCQSSASAYPRSIQLSASSPSSTYDNDRDRMAAKARAQDEAMARMREEMEQQEKKIRELLEVKRENDALEERLARERRALDMYAAAAASKQESSAPQETASAPPAYSSDTPSVPVAWPSAAVASPYSPYGGVAAVAAVPVPAIAVTATTPYTTPYGVVAADSAPAPYAYGGAAALFGQPMTATATVSPPGYTPYGAAQPDASVPPAYSSEAYNPYGGRT